VAPQPGKMLLVDLEQGRLIPDDVTKATLAKSHPYSDWLHRTQLVLEELPDAPTKGMRSNLPLLDRQQAFGYVEDVTILMTPMAATGEEAAGSGQRHADLGAVAPAEAAVHHFKQNLRRSPTRRSIRSARNS
jgi:glutamate synthase (NADPH/NADH) large chain